MEMIGLIFRPEVMIFLIPLTAIAGRIYLKAQRMKLQQGGIHTKTNRVIKQLIEENLEMKERVKNLEMIITSEDKDISSLKVLEKRELEPITG